MHVDGENAALKRKVENLRDTALLTDCLASHHVHRCTYNMQNKSSQKLLEKQCKVNECSELQQEADVLMKQDGTRAVTDREAFHWTGVNVCDVARQRDEAIQEATLAAAEVSRAQRELFLIRTELNRARAAEESAAQVNLRSCHQLPVSCICLKHVWPECDHGNLSCRLLARFQGCLCSVLT